MNVSVIATVYNEGENLYRLLDSLAAQSRPPDQVVIVDGGSQDNTLDLLHAYAESSRLPLEVLSAPGSNISRGRNLAIQAAAGPIIAATDAGVVLEADWLAKLVAPIEAGASTAAGFFLPDPHSLFETAMGATVLPSVEDIDPRSFMPSSRSVAFLKEAWQAAGSYPEWLDYCEDLLFDFALRDRYGPFPFVPDALVRFRPRSSLRHYFIQYYRYARGDGKADLWRVRHAVRYATYLVGVPLITWLSIRLSPLFWLLFPLAAAVYVYRPIRRLLPRLAGIPAWAKLGALALVPLIRLVGDGAKMIGYPVGVWWRLTTKQDRRPKT